jgi:hypothetical protein
MRKEIGTYGEHNMGPSPWSFGSVQQQVDEPLPFGVVGAEREYLLELIDDEQCPRIILPMNQCLSNGDIKAALA